MLESGVGQRYNEDPAVFINETVSTYKRCAILYTRLPTDFVDN